MDEKNDVSLNNNNKKERQFLTLLLFIPCFLIRRVLDNDVWFLLNSGRYVLNHGIPQIEPFSIHKNLEFVMQQWLTDIIFWKIYYFFGENGLFILVMICYAIIIFLMFKLTLYISNKNFIISFLITSLSSFLIYTYMVTRPTIFTLIIVMVELIVLEKYANSNNKKYLFVLPVLSLLMINLHAALWPILFILILPYIVDSLNIKYHFITGGGYSTKYLIIIIIVMFMVAFINPYGIDSMTYLIKSTGYADMKNIVELQAPYINSVLGATTYLYIAFILIVYIFYRDGSAKIRYFFLTVGTVYMVLTSLRNITYFAIGSLFPLAHYLKNSNFIDKTNIGPKNIKLRIILVTLIIFAIICTGTYNDEEYKTTYTEYLDLNNTIDYIVNNEDTSNIIIYTGFNDGSLVQFRGLPTYIDPRAEVYFKKLNKKDEIFNEYFDMKYGRVYYKDVLNKYNFTHLIVSKDDILYTYLPEDKDYNEIYKNDTYIVYEKIR
jgi:hypothetical protein